MALLLARRLEWASTDLDREIERHAGKALAGIFEEEGEERFRDLESRALAEALDGKEPVVVACGGGVLGREENRRLLRAHAHVVWLTVDPEEAAARLGEESSARPLLRAGPVAELLGELLNRRERAYAAAANATVDTGGSPPEEVAERIASMVARLRA